MSTFKLYYNKKPKWILRLRTYTQTKRLQQRTAIYFFYDQTELLWRETYILGDRVTVLETYLFEDRFWEKWETIRKRLKKKNITFVYFLRIRLWFMIVLTFHVYFIDFPWFLKEYQSITVHGKKKKWNPWSVIFLFILYFIYFDEKTEAFTASSKY